LDPRAFGIGKKFARAFNKLILRRKFRNLRRKIAGKTLHRQAYVKVGTYPNHKILGREEVAVKWKEQIAIPPSWISDFEFHKKLDETWAKRLKEHNLFLTQLIDECKEAKRPIFIVYIPCYQVFLRGMNKSQLMEANPLAKSLRKLCSEKKTPFFDVSLAFVNEPKPAELYFLFDGHLNPAGHKKLAEYLQAPIREFINSLN
ncbi:MAG: SGNH/GDSL hydrolase family protein, partial [Planctomycetota bacterium]|nr:SGNH/GDSL hydrolase family protein [Planctomycetota bacterium]